MRDHVKDHCVLYRAACEVCAILSLRFTALLLLPCPRRTRLTATYAVQSKVMDVLRRPPTRTRGRHGCNNSIIVFVSRMLKNRLVPLVRSVPPAILDGASFDRGTRVSVA